MRTILHVDMDAFFASVEVKDNPSLRGRPLLVGGASRRGVVAAASYEARKFGVHSAMPMAEALRRCPKAVVVSPNRERYEEESAHVFSIFRRFTPLVEGLSLDEAFLDVTRSRELFGSGEAIGQAIRSAIFQETALTASAGVAACKFVAKLASDMNKPNGITVVPEEGVEQFLSNLPIERMWGVGAKTAPHLYALGIRTFADLVSTSDDALERAVGSWGPEMKLLARGIDSRPVEPSQEAKSIGAESTFEHDLVTREEIDRTLLAHAARIAERLLHEKLFTQCVSVKLKYSDFQRVSRQVTVDEPICDTTSIYETAREAVARCPLRPVRLTGISVSHLIEADRAPRILFPDPAKQKRARLEGIIVGLHDRFGKQSVTRATLLEEEDVVVPEDQRV